MIIFNRSKDQILDVAGVLDHGLVGKRPAVFVSSKNMLRARRPRPLPRQDKDK